MVDLEERLARSYRILFSNTKENSIIFLLKGIVYKIALFLAKKKGRLPFFFSKNEKKFDNMKLSEQYQVFLKNQANNSESDLENIKLPSIDLVLHANGEIENINRIIEFVSSFSNFKLYIILMKQDSNYFKTILNNFKIQKYKIIKKDKNEKIQRMLNNIISESESSFILFLDSKKCTIHADSLYQISKFCNKGSDIIYCDSDLINNKVIKPFFKPGWSPQLLLSFNYIENFVTYSVSLLKEMNGFDEKIDSYEYDFLLRAIENTDKVTHIQKVLFSKFKENNDEINSDKVCLQNFLKKNKIYSEVTTNQNYFSIKPKINSGPLISIIIPTKNNKNLLLKCIKSIQKSTYKNYEIIIINNGNKIESRLEINCNIIDYKESFNFSKINNFATNYANGEYLLFLNDDTEVINEDWLEHMLFYSRQENVGVVGSLLLFPKSRLYPNTIQHAGVTLGTVSPAIHSFSFSHYTKQNNLNFDKISRNVSAVTAACMMIRKDVFEQVGEFDEKFVITFGDIDMCLRIKEKGYQIAYCADSKLYHAESTTRKSTYPLDDEIQFLNRWENHIISGDEFYNPNLTHINRNFRIAPYPSEIPAISLLKEIFYFREDLQKQIPDYDKNIDAMTDWAAIKGVTIDSARAVLVPYNRFFLDNSSENIRKVADAIYKFNHSLELQKKFPEVFAGKYDRLLSYVQTKQ